MTKASNFKRAVRLHAAETGQRYTDALTDLEGVEARMSYERTAVEALLAHLRDYYGVDAVAARQISVNNTYVFRVDRKDAEPWVARVFPPGRPREGAEGDAAVLRFLEAHDYPAERLAVDDAVTELDGRAVLVTRFVEGGHFPPRAERWKLADLLGRLHALGWDESISRPGGSTGEDPSREGGPRQELEAALSFLNAVDAKVPAVDRERFERLRDRVRSGDDGHGLPEGLIHGNLFHSPHHAIVTGQGPALINWKASGRGPRMVDFAELVWGTPANDLQATVDAYRQHIDVTDEELDRLEAVMWRRPLYITSFGYRRNINHGLTQNVWWFVEPPEAFREVADATRSAFKRWPGTGRGCAEEVR